jgi:hypothetical protein
MSPDDYMTSIDTPFKTVSIAGDVELSGVLRSTVYTSHEPIQRLFLWNQKQDEIMEDTDFVKKFLDCDARVFIVFFSRFFVTLAQILSSQVEQSDRIGCSLLIGVLSKVDEAVKTWSWYRSFLDDIIASKFSAANPTFTELYKVLLGYIVGSFPESGDVVMNDEMIAKLGECCRCLKYLFTIMRASLKLAEELGQNSRRESFAVDVRAIFSRFLVLLRQTAPGLSDYQLIACRAIPVLLDSIVGFFDDAEGTELIVNLMKELQESQSPFRVEALSDVCAGEFFSPCASKLLPVVIDCLSTVPAQEHQEFSELLELAFYGLMRNVNSKPLVNQLVPFIPRVLRAKDPADDCFLIFYLYFCDDSVVERLILEAEDKVESYKYILTVIKKVVIPSSPLHLCFVTVNIFIRVLSLSQKPEFRFLADEIEQLVVSVADFYTTFLKFFGALPDCDRAFCQRIYHSELGPIAALLPSLLHSIPTETRFNPGVFMPLIHFFVLQSEPLTRASVVDGFYLVVEADHLTDHTFSRSENAIIQAMDEVNNSVADLSDLNILFNAVNKKFADAEAFFTRLNQLAGFLSDLAQFPLEPVFEDERSTAIYEILQVCRSSKNYRLFSHFTSKLYDVHRLVNNKPEAAETLCLCADMFSWASKDLVGPGHGLPQQTQREGKRYVLHEAIDLFIQSQFFEPAQWIIDEPRQFYMADGINYVAVCCLYWQEKKRWEGVCSTEETILNRFYGAHFYGARSTNTIGTASTSIVATSSL